MIDLQEMKPSDVYRAYIGKPGCMCGCKGKYYATVERDYTAVSLPKVTETLRMIQLAAARGEDVESEPGFLFSATVKGKSYCVYLHD